MSTFRNKRHNEEDITMHKKKTIRQRLADLRTHIQMSKTNPSTGELGAASGSVVPGPGTIIGGLIGAIGGGMAVSFVADQLIEDDAVEMERIIENQFIALANEYLINEAEAATISDQLIEKLTTDKKVLKEMFASKNRTNYARNTLLLPEVKKVVDSRKKITFPSKEEYSVAIMEVLGDLYEAEAEEAS